MECHLKWNVNLYVTQHVISFIMEFHSTWNVKQNGMSLKMECHSKWNVLRNEISFKI